MRATVIARVREQLLRKGFPRLQMFILVSLTGLAGLLASFTMLHYGVDGMALRYTLAMAVAYLVFLLLLWFWLHTNADDYVDPLGQPLCDAGGDVLDATGRAALEIAGDLRAGRASFDGGGGTFDGGGASGNVDFPLADDGIGAAVGKPLEAAAHADEAALPLAVILLALGIVLSSLFVVWSAPLLFAEILVDSLLAAGLYRRLRGIAPRHWMRAALRRTILPFVLTTLVVAGAGWGMQQYAPEARSLGEVLDAR